MTERRFRTAATLAALVAALHPFVYLPFMSRHTTGDSAEYVALARAIRHGSYSTRIADQEVVDYTPTPHRVDLTGITWSAAARQLPQSDAYRTPGYPLLLAAVGGGGAGASRHVLYAVQAVLIGLTAVLLALLVRRLWGPRIALVAAIVFALDPYSKRYVTMVLGETLAGFLATASGYALVRSWQERSVRWWTATGLLVGALTLVRPVFAIAIPLVAVGALLAAGVGARRRIVVAAACLAGSLVVVLPWIARNAAVTGKAALADYGAGWNLLIAAHGEGYGRTMAQVYASPSYARDFAAPQRFAPTVEQLRTDHDAYARYLVKADAVQRSTAIDLYLHRLGRDPSRVLWEFGYRAYFLWMAHTDWFQPTGIKLFLLRLVDWAVMILAIVGVALELRAGRAGRALGVFLIVYTLVSALGHVEARYTVPLRSLYLGFATLALCRLAALARGWRASRSGDPAPA